MATSYLNTIQICIKARKFSFGDTLLENVRTNKVYLVIVANDAGLSNKKKIIDKCKYYGVEYIELLDKKIIYDLFQKNISSFGITDKNLAFKLLQNIKKEETCNEK